MTCNVARAGLIIAALAATGFTLTGCSHKHAGQSVSGVVTEADRDQVSCEVGLLRLARLIQQRSSQARFSEVALLEARELHQLGRELYLEGEYALAREMIEEGIRLLEEQSD